MKAKLVKFAGWFTLLINDIVHATEDNGPYFRLSKSNCEAIERGYDLDELASEYSEGKSTAEVFKIAHESDFKAGFQKALELMGGKKFTEQDIHEAYFLGERDDRGGLHDILKSQEQHEWDVEIETVEYGLGNDQDGRPVTENKFVLDADGCLILKRMKSL